MKFSLNKKEPENEKNIRESAEAPSTGISSLDVAGKCLEPEGIAFAPTKEDSSSPAAIPGAATTAPAPVQESGFQQQWNYPQINLWRTLAACWGMIIIGAGDAVIGALIPYLEVYYNISYTIVSLIFISPFVGYSTSAVLINQVHMRFGQRGIAIIGPGCRVVAYVIISQHPPYPVLVLAYVLTGFGGGLQDAAWNAWVGNMLNANQVMGFMHGAYGLGGALAPLIATSLITKAYFPWYVFYYFMIGATVLEQMAAGTAFWANNGKRYRDANPRTTEHKGGRTKEALSNRITWMCAFFLLIYVGIEVAVGGWVVSFMINIRNAGPFPAGMSATGFWLGITVGRVILGFVTPRFGEKLAVLIYFALSVVLQLLFWLVPSLPTSYVCIGLLGFFLGPLYPACIVAATKILPQHLHISAVGFAAAFGSSGACILPFAVGAIAQEKGVQVLMPIVLAMLVADAAVWAVLPLPMFPALKRQRNLEERAETSETT